MTAPPRDVTLLQNVSMAELTTMGTGGRARYFARTRNAEQARTTISWAREAGLRLWLLGGGSNVLVADEGLDGLVLQPVGEEIHLQNDGAGGVLLRAEAGRSLDSLVSYSVERGLAGLSALSGIPGTVGAAPVQNVGAYGQAIGETLVEVLVLDCHTGALATWPLERCELSYRDSLFRREATGRYLILEVTLRLRAGELTTPRYPELRKRLGLPPQEDHGPAPSLSALREAVLTIRRAKGMVLDPDDPDSRSAGSFFTNPILPLPEVEAVRERLSDRLKPQEKMPQHPVDGEFSVPHIKLSAAWLIERCGMSKGYGEGRVGLSRKHVLALVNRGDASTKDVLEFAEHVSARVEATCGIRLNREPIWMGSAHPLD